MTLINDPVYTVVITAETGSRHEGTGRTFMTKVVVMTPEGTTVSIDHEDLTSAGASVEWNAKLDTAVVGDITCKKMMTEDRTQYHCEIQNGPNFLISNHNGHRALSFAVTDTSNLSEKVTKRKLK